ncbi:MAG: alternate F1F0 ATPase, F1 subunit alpha [Methylocystis sp.]
MAPDGFQKAVDEAFAGLDEARRSFAPELRTREIGVVASVATGIAKVSGLPGVGFEELVKFPGDLLGIAFNVDEDEVGVVLLGEYERLQAGDEVERTGRVMDVAVGDALLGRVIDPLGRPIDDGGPVNAIQRLPIERPAAPIMDRAPVVEPLQTGIKVIDALVPIGRGQRELILGDRQIGKTAIALDTILNQLGQNVICVYCAIGQRASVVAKAVATLKEKGAMDHTVVVVTHGNDPPGLAYIAPYAATSIAEYFMEAGRDVLIVYDDLTQHAEAYRELSLLLRRPPGREAFPGDIFYIHSRLLERSTRLRAELGGGSLTALPIVETEAQNLSAYIPTNLISITDGQIYLSPSLFELGVLPAIDVGKSVSRVGGKAQRGVYRDAAGDLKLSYAQFEELETFARFGARLDEDTRKIIEHGQRIRACLKQTEFAPVSVPEQIAMLLTLAAGLFDSIPIERMAEAERLVVEAASRMPEGLRNALEKSEKLSEEVRKSVLDMARQALTQLQSSPSGKAGTASDLKPDINSGTALPPAAKPEPEAIQPPATVQRIPATTKPFGFWLSFVIILAAIVGLIGFLETRREPAKPDAAAPAPTASGHVAAVGATPVEARVPGVIQTINCVVGMQVKAGQICAKLDPAPYQAILNRRATEMKAANEQLQKQADELNQAKANVARLDARAKRRAVAYAQIEAAHMAVEQAREREEIAKAAAAKSEAALGAAKAELDETDILAPIDGIIVAQDLQTGQTVAPNATQPLFLIAASLTAVRIEASVDAKDIGGIAPGAEVQFTVDAYPNRSFSGQVTQMDATPPTVGEAKVYALVITASNSDLSLKPGMTATIRLVSSNSMIAPTKDRP